MPPKKQIKKAPEYKAGQYFKAEYNGYKITGRIGTTKEEDYHSGNMIKGLYLAFKNSCIDDYNISAEKEEDYGFKHDAEIDRAENLEIITKRQHEALLKNPFYSGFHDYYINVMKGHTSDKDLFKFGCGAVAVRRAEIEALLKIFRLVKPAELRKVADLLARIEAESVYLTDADIPKIKQLLA